MPAVTAPHERGDGVEQRLESSPSRLRVGQAGGAAGGVIGDIVVAYEGPCGNWWMMPVLSMSAMPRISRSTRS
jgi:hypothetical protein